MTDRKELLELADRMRSFGARVDVHFDGEGWIETVSVGNAKGIGPFPMSPISAAETMRAWLARPSPSQA